MHLSIPKPCHERWTEMTPTEQGAFCKKCAVDVIDFSEKSPHQIKDILLKNKADKLCGRFSKKQLDELKYNYTNWHDQSVPIFKRKFLLACLVVFGMTLFTGCEVSSAKGMEAPIWNRTEMSLFENEPADSTIMVTDSLKTADYIDTIEYVKGELHIPMPVEGTNQVRIGDSIYNVPIPDSLAIQKPPVIETYAINRGLLEPPHGYKFYGIDTSASIRRDSLQQVQNKEISFMLELIQPVSSGRCKIAMQSKTPGDYSIRIYGLNGQLLQELESGKVLDNQRRIIGIDISSFSSGFYIIEVQINNKKQTLKIQKVD